ncbi:phosphoglycerate mutase 1 family protein [Hyphomonas neptunium ATCC 15444]|uniref:2,3-bisphosphoglycerate-dependent phosphoglycerate mutase n=2 Tax=Hyphomonas TaxID=85 RepID=GPMA_HYPNA|nr:MULTISPECIES: 2,3-diphosphoglycerate-dependent phosphoglycerate mutase [Hyphomonas]Q0C678.1 RecName: Full=2,3-bisphosphoglycerate-dependent phosphoglycerate mutase; Short=BPG-dependent PGAM; Short=PGAM; Short=Phosphoglyceromutase; Short=dPGM [Hyphomonas neptunium ATCC 15444]ABI75447.1 phosphoglycerate mutase 1 family protein [Hyphomonas neptunium ATCC 15444]KCZ94845.1 phosphoglycerate mutase [Hyphomonas hirschiana VP5]
MTKLALIRHGQSAWNLENRFTGWWDADLTAQGEAEARHSGKLLAEVDADFRAGFTSVQTRAIRTMWLALTEMKRVWLPIEKDWHLNERHYGGLTGLNKAETAAKHGEDQVHVWRRSYDIPPPPLEVGSTFDLSTDPRYRGIDIPNTESLKTTLDRVLPYWQQKIAPGLIAGTDTMIAAHGNSLRALVKHLFNVPDETITGLEIPTGNPLLIELDPNLKPVSVRYLDAERAHSLPDLP